MISRQEQERLASEMDETLNKHLNDPSAGFADKEIGKLCHQIIQSQMLAYRDGRKDDAFLLGTIARMVIEVGKKVSSHERGEARKANILPLVIIDGQGLDYCEAILVNGAQAVMIDWDEIGQDKKEAQRIYDQITGYFRDSDTKPDTRINNILDRLDSVFSDGDPESSGPEPESEGGDYKGLKHNGEPDCPACEAFEREHGADALLRHLLEKVYGR